MIKYNKFRACLFLQNGGFMIKIKISDLLGKHKMTQKALSEITGIRPATISKCITKRQKELMLSI